jgi:hypothetical protein
VLFEVLPDGRSDDACHAVTLVGGKSVKGIGDGFGELNGNSRVLFEKTAGYSH